MTTMATEVSVKRRGRPPKSAAPQDPVILVEAASAEPSTGKARTRSKKQTGKVDENVEEEPAKKSKRRKAAANAAEGAPAPATTATKSKRVAKKRVSDNANAPIGPLGSSQILQQARAFVEASTVLHNDFVSLVERSEKNVEGDQQPGSPGAEFHTGTEKRTASSTDDHQEEPSPLRRPDGPLSDTGHSRQRLGTPVPESLRLTDGELQIEAERHHHQEILQDLPPADTSRMPQSTESVPAPTMDSPAPSQPATPTPSASTKTRQKAKATLPTPAKAGRASPTRSPPSSATKQQASPSPPLPSSSPPSSSFNVSSPARPLLPSRSLPSGGGGTPPPQQPRPTEVPYHVLKKDPRFKSLSRRWTGIIVGIPFVVVTSVVLYQRCKYCFLFPFPTLRSPSVDR